ncbi:MAG: PHB depolymerase family esterase [Betaproteobacteria bacterium]
MKSGLLFKQAALQSAMTDAMRLMRSGNLMEATAAIQNNLQGFGTQASGASVGEASNDAAIEGRFERVHPEAPIVTHPSAPGVPERASADATPTETINRAGTRGRFLALTFSNHAGTREYKLYVPDSYCGEPLPLLIMLHGCTQTPDDFAAGTRMNTLAEEQHWLVAYPAQPSSANGSKCWNWFTTEGQRRGRGEPSLIAGITAQVMKDYAVDSRRVYVAGLSSGGAMAAIMGATYPDLYAAVGVHSGLAYGAAHDLPSALAAMKHGSPGLVATPARDSLGESGNNISLIIFHGDRDSTVHARNGEQLTAQWKASHSGRERGDSEVGWQTTEELGRVPNGHAYTRRIVRSDAQRAVLEQWSIHGAGHAWSGGSPQGTYTNPKGPDAAREMLRFFSENPKS